MSVEKSKNFLHQGLETHHEDMVHDAQLDYYGLKLATCSSDRTIKIFDLDGEERRELETLKGHDGPVWRVDWAHPKFGIILASCSYDGKVFIWKDHGAGSWKKIKEHTLHTASVNSVAWGPHELGPILACASSDNKVSVLTFKDDGSWDAVILDAHSIGANSVSWAPATIPGALVQVTGGAPNVNVSKRFASCGCDNLVKIWAYSEDTKEWKEEETLEGHTDWVRDVAWAPNFGLPQNYLASCSQDKTVIIWKKNNPTSPWVKKFLKSEKFLDVVWSVSWSMSGTILAVASGDNKVTLWQENLKGEWEQVQELDD